MKLIIISLVLALVALTLAASEKDSSKKTTYSKNNYKYDGNIAFDWNSSAKSSFEGLARYAQEVLKLFGISAAYEGNGASQTSAQGVYRFNGEGGDITPGVDQNQVRPVPEARKASSK